MTFSPGLVTFQTKKQLAGLQRQTGVMRVTEKLLNYIYYVEFQKNNFNLGLWFSEHLQEL